MLLPMTPEPTDQDRRNAETRARIAERFQREYDQVVLWAMGKFGDGWLPRGKHFLVSKEAEERHRVTGEPIEAAATVYTVRREDGEQRHFVVEEGLVREVADYKEAFGPMLLEPHPTAGFTDQKGEFHPVHRYSLCWGPIETYQPKSADQLAALRVSRERNKAIREQEEFEREHPLWAEIERQEREEGRSR